MKSEESVGKMPDNKEDCKKSNEKKHTDRRVIKTKKAIRNAFAKLLSVKDIDTITIKDIADYADINRKTFYNYYAGIHEILEEIENEIILDLESALRDVDFSKDLKEQPNLIFAKLSDIINRDADFYGYLIKGDRNTNLINKIKCSIRDKLKSELKDKIDLSPESLAIAADYMVAGVVAVYQEWFNSGMKQSSEEMTEKLGTLVLRGVNGLIKSEQALR